MSKEQKPVAWRYENKNVKGNWYITWTEPPDGFNKRPLYESQDANRIEELERERDALQADNARLREALEDSYMTNPCDTHSQQAAFDKAQSALFATPEQSITEYRNKVIEELAITIQNDESGRDGNGYFAELIRTMKEQP